jgi:hypothetical protein
MARLGTRQTDFSQGLIITGSFIVSGSSTFIGNQVISGSLIVPSGSAFTGSLFGTASYALDYPLPFQIVSGSITASVSDNPSSLFLIKSGSTTYLNVSSSGNAELYSNLFIIKNFSNQQPVLTISQSIVQFATQSSNPAGTAPNGGIWFTSASMYVGLD